TFLSSFVERNLLTRSWLINRRIDANTFVRLKSSSVVAIFKNGCISMFCCLQFCCIISKIAISFIVNLYLFFVYDITFLYLLYIFNINSFFSSVIFAIPTQYSKKYNFIIFKKSSSVFIIFFYSFVIITNNTKLNFAKHVKLIIYFILKSLFIN